MQIGVPYEGEIRSGTNESQLLSLSRDSGKHKISLKVDGHAMNRGSVGAFCQRRDDINPKETFFVVYIDAVNGRREFSQIHKSISDRGV